MVDYGTCPVCNEELEEVLGDGDNFEVDTIGYKPHTDCEQD